MNDVRGIFRQESAEALELVVDAIGMLQRAGDKDGASALAQRLLVIRRRADRGVYERQAEREEQARG